MKSILRGLNPTHPTNHDVSIFILNPAVGIWRSIHKPRMDTDRCGQGDGWFNEWGQNTPAGGLGLLCYAMMQLRAWTTKNGTAVAAAFRGSADFQSAVSPNGIRQSVVFSGRVRFACGQRMANPRSSRIQFCAASVVAPPRQENRLLIRADAARIERSPARRQCLANGWRNSR